MKAVRHAGSYGTTRAPHNKVQRRGAGRPARDVLPSESLLGLAWAGPQTGPHQGKRQTDKPHDRQDSQVCCSSRGCIHARASCTCPAARWARAAGRSTRRSLTPPPVEDRRLQPRPARAAGSNQRCWWCWSWLWCCWRWRSPARASGCRICTGSQEVCHLVHQILRRNTPRRTQGTKGQHISQTVATPHGAWCRGAAPVVCLAEGVPRP